MHLNENFKQFCDRPCIFKDFTINLVTCLNYFPSLRWTNAFWFFLSSLEHTLVAFHPSHECSASGATAVVSHLSESLLISWWKLYTPWEFPSNKPSQGKVGRPFRKRLVTNRWGDQVSGSSKQSEAILWGKIALKKHFATSCLMYWFSLFFVFLIECQLFIVLKSCIMICAGRKQFRLGTYWAGKYEEGNWLHNRTVRTKKLCETICACAFNFPRS